MQQTTTLAWKKLTSEQIADCKVFSVNRHISQHIGVRGERVSDFYVLKPNDWVNIIAITPDNQVVMVEQYRHGVEAVTLEIPGGGVDHDDLTHLQAAQRELLEETGYAGSEIVSLGFNYPNPAIQSNLCHTYLVKNVEKVREPVFESNEETVVKLVPLDEIDRLIVDGKINHALVIVAFHLLKLRSGLSNPSI
jgi:ADP-ribose pyrophosphatase